MAVANSSNISTIQILRSYANSAPASLVDGQLAYSFVSNTLYIGSNNYGVIAISDQATANLARQLSNTIIGIQGVDNTQNASINTVNVLAQAAFNSANNVAPQVQPAFNQANAALVLANAAYAQANVTIGVDTTQNTRLTVIEGTNVSQNARMTIIEGTDVGQNTRLTIIENTNLTQNTSIAATDGKMSSAYNQANTGTVLAQAAFDNSNTKFASVGGTISGNVIISKDLTVTGNLSVLGNSVIISTTSLDIGDSLIYLANNNYFSDVVDIGIIGHYNPGSSNAHTGIFRDPVRKEWIFFQGYQPEVQSNNIINIADPTFAYANVWANTFKGNLIGTTVVVNNIQTTGSSGNISGANFVYANTFVASNSYIFPDGTVQTTAASASLASGAYNQANTATVLAQASYNQANVTIGVDASQNARMIIIEATDVSQNARMTIIEGVDVGQNTNILTVTALAQAAFNRANTEPDAQNYAANTIIVANSAGYLSNSNSFFVASNNTIVVPSVNITSILASTSNTTGALVITGGLGVSGNTYLSGNLVVSNTSTNLNTLQYSQGSYVTESYLGITNSSTFAGLRFNITPSTGGPSYTFNTYGSPTTIGSPQFSIGHTSSTVNYLQATGSPVSNTLILSSQGSDTNVSLTLQPKGTGALNFAPGANGVNISNGGTVTAITGTATGSGYTTIPTITISAPTTAGGTQATGTVGMQALTATIVSGGTGYTANDVLTVVGGTGTAAQITVSTVSSGVITAITVSLGGTYTVLPTNPVSVTGGTGSSATFNLTSYGVRTTAYTITNAGSGYVEQPTVTFSSGSATAYATVGGTSIIRSIGSDLSFYTAQGEGFRVADTQTSAVNYLVAQGSSSTGNTPTLSVAGTSGTLNLRFTSKSSGSLLFYTNSSTNQQFSVVHTASAVNYVQVTGSATTGTPVISSQGSDTAVGLNFVTKGSSNIGFYTNSGTSGLQFVISASANVVNRIVATGSATGVVPSFSVSGTDTDIGINLTAKGNGSVNITSTLASTSNTTGALVVSGGLGVGGNVSMNLSSTITGATRLTLSQQNYIYAGDTAGNIVFGGSGYYYLNSGGGTYVGGLLRLRGPISNDTGNNVLIFSGTSSLLIQNTTPSTSNTTGSLVVGGGLGVGSNVSMNLASSGTGVNRLTLSPQSYFTTFNAIGDIAYNGPSGAAFLFNNSQVYIQNQLIQRGPIFNDAGNNTVVFAGASPILIQNGTASTNTTTGALIVQGGVGISGALNATTKSFNIPHPTKSGKSLRYGSLEGPEFGVYVRGTLKGSNTIQLPDYWIVLADPESITVQLTAIGKTQNLFVKEIRNNKVIVGIDGLSAKDINCYYTVFGERADVAKLEVEG